MSTKLFVLAGILLCWGMAVQAGDYPAAFATADSADPQLSSRMQPLAEGCPEQGGVLDSVAVPARDSIELVIVTSQPAPEGGATFVLGSGDPAVAAAGDPRQALLPQVHIPEGETASNPFTVYGLAVGDTMLSATSLTPGFFGFSVPLGTWDVGEQADRKFLDPNGLVAHCRESDDSSILSTDESILANCGVTARGAVTDGTSRLLMRTRSGLEGTACFRITSDETHDGSIEVPVKLTEPVDSVQQASSYYRAPEYFEDPGFLPARMLEVEFVFTPAFGNGNTTRMTGWANLIRPPQVLVHGLWSDSSGFRWFWNREDLFNTTTRADYEPTNDSHFVVNVPEVRRSIAEAVASSTEKGFSTTRVDVVGHSMGGILSRLHVQSDRFVRPDNLGEGDIRRLVTVATPHLGSTFANLLVALHEFRPVEAMQTVRSLLGSDALIDRGAICDLAENSAALQAFSAGTSVPTHVVTANGGPFGSQDNPADYFGGLAGIGSFERAMTYRYCTPTVGPCIPGDFRFPQDVVDGFRFRQRNDAIVQLSSAQAGFDAGSTVLQDFDLIHFGINALGFPVVSGVTNRRSVRNHVHSRLDEPVDSDAWAGGYPSFGTSGHPADGSGETLTVPGVPDPDNDGINALIYELQCVDGPLVPAGSPSPEISLSSRSDGVEVIAPTPGQEFAPGDVVEVSVQLAPDIVPDDVAVMVPGLGLIAVDNLVNGTYDAVFGVPIEAAGSLELVPVVRTDAGDQIEGNPVQFAVVPTEPPQGLELFQRAHRLDINRDRPLQLRVAGIYSDELERSLSAGVTGTSYESSDTAVATVGADGEVDVTGLGNAVITVSHRGLTEFAMISVRDAFQPLPPSDVTSEVAVRAGGYRLNRNTGFFTQEVVVANQGAIPLFGQLHAVIEGMDDAVRVVNASGVTREFPATGLPFSNVELATDGLHFYPGDSSWIRFDFLNPDLASIAYELRVIQSTLTP